MFQMTAESEDRLLLTQFAHTLLFACPDCRSPIVICRVTSEKNQEELDGESLPILCGECGCSSEITGITAKRHYVEEWGSSGFCSQLNARHRQYRH
jgi:hypothetical protein